MHTISKPKKKCLDLVANKLNHHAYSIIRRNTSLHALLKKTLNFYYYKLKLGLLSSSEMWKLLYGWLGEVLFFVRIKLSSLA